MAKKIKKYSIIFVALLLVFLFLITLTYCIPNNSIISNINNGYKIFDIEGLHPMINTNDRGSIIDNFTDEKMLFMSDSRHSNPIIQAMDANEWSRYWHGYLIFVRPLLVFFNYSQMRIVLGFVLIVIIFVNTYLISKKINIFVAFSFLLSLFFVRGYIFFLSFQFSNMFLLMMIFNIIVLTRDDDFFINKKYFCLFFAFGMITNYFDFLTTPIITLSIPLILLILADKINGFLNVIISSVQWVVGYSITWVSKWIISSLILNEDIIETAIYKILFRTAGNEEYPLNRVETVLKNLSISYSKVYVFILLVITLLFFVVILYKRKPIIKDVFSKYKVLFFIMTFPFIWIIVLSNHSQIHYFIAYRNFFITTFIYLSLISISFNKIIKK